MAQGIRFQWWCWCAGWKPGLGRQLRPRWKPEPSPDVGIRLRRATVGVGVGLDRKALVGVGLDRKALGEVETVSNAGASSRLERCVSACGMLRGGAAWAIGSCS